jgi:hypothetical protein
VTKIRTPSADRREQIRSRLSPHRFSIARSLPPVDVRRSSGIRQAVPSERVRYLAEITETLRNYHAQTDPTIWILRAWSSTRMESYGSSGDRYSLFTEGNRGTTSSSSRQRLAT